MLEGGLTSTQAATGAGAGCQMTTMGNGSVSITSTPADGAAAAGGNSTSGGAGQGLETTSDVDGMTTASIDSHLDSFFASHAITRDDVMVLAAAVQLAMWAALLYLEVSK